MNQKSFFLISFLPALAYWYLEENYPIRIAIAGGLALAVLEMALEKIFTKHIHAISRFNFFLILFLGLISLLGEDGIWFKLQPAFTGVVMGIYLLFKLKTGKGLMLEMMQSTQQKIPMDPKLIYFLERDMAIFLFFYGLFMGGVAFKGTTDQWLFFKTAGFYIIFVIFFVFEIILMRQRQKTRD